VCLFQDLVTLTLCQEAAMVRKVLGRLFAVAGALVFATPVLAHHAFSAAFDENKPVTVKGVMVEIRLENPHSWFFLDVTDETGKVTRWGFEGNTPTSLIRSGYKRDAVKVGDRVTIRGSRARDMTAMMGAAREIVLEDGRSFIVGPKGNEPN
jgi:hypothetical protein